MQEECYRELPPQVVSAEEIAQAHGYELSSNRNTGAILRVLAAAKPDGKLLELGTGVGVGSSWLLAGMTGDASLVTVELHPQACELAEGVFDGDPRVTVVNERIEEFLERQNPGTFDLIFADAGAPKFFNRSQVIDLLAPGGLLVCDDLLPQAKWGDSHPALVSAFRREILEDPRLYSVLMDWGAGLSVSARRT